MAVQMVCVCDLCNKTIRNPEDGFIVEGNVYVALPEERGGLIGNNIILNEQGDIELRSTVICKACLIDTLNLKIESKR